MAYISNCCGAVVRWGSTLAHPKPDSVLVCSACGAVVGVPEGEA